MKLYTLTYKDKQLIKQGLVEASSLEMADKLGRDYCKEGSQRRYIGVRDAILLREGSGTSIPAVFGTDKPETPNPKRAA